MDLVDLSWDNINNSLIILLIFREIITIIVLTWSTFFLVGHVNIVIESYVVVCSDSIENIGTCC